MQARLGQQISRQMLQHELAVRDISIDGANDVIAILIGIGGRVIVLVATRLGIADQVEPVPAPALAEMRRRQQPIHHLFPGFPGCVFNKGFHILGSRRQPEQIEGDPANPGAPVRGRRRLQALGFQ